MFHHRSNSILYLFYTYDLCRYNFLNPSLYFESKVYCIIFLYIFLGDKTCKTCFHRLGVHYITYVYYLYTTYRCLFTIKRDKHTLIFTKVNCNISSMNSNNKMLCNIIKYTWSGIKLRPHVLMEIPNTT